MILYYKNPIVNKKRPISCTTTKVQRRKKKVIKLTKANKDFLKAIGFKV